MKREERTPAQQAMKGDWRKNFLAFVKNSHMKFWKNKSKIDAIDYFTLYPGLLKFSREVATKEGFVEIYSIKDLREAFEKYFRTKSLYRDLMLSNRLRKSTKNAYSKSLEQFYQAFLTLVFESIQ
jgi:hypothetical protein